ncbi:hypothetical protein BH09SUM1_BH09SUM1_20590 [soil metagenome]
MAVTNERLALLTLPFLCALCFTAWADSQGITLVPMFVDADGIYGAGFGTPQHSGMAMEFYFEEGLYKRFDNILGPVNNFQTSKDPGTIYVYRYEAAEMDGPTMGYNHLGNGAFFHPTILLSSAAVREITWRVDGGASTAGVVVECVSYIADRNDIPSIALSQGFSKSVMAGYSGRMGVSYLPGNDLFPGHGSYEYPQGGVQFAMIGFWGPFVRDPSSHETIFSNTSAVGPMEVSFGMDGYTTTTVTLVGVTHHIYDYRNILAAIDSKSASDYLQQIHYEPLPPPAWVKRMALEEKLTGKTKWLYPPLKRHADANGDGVYDAADLAAVYAGGAKTAE